MSKQWGHGFNKGLHEGYEIGEGAGRGMSEWKIANEMRVLFCALITAHEREDTNAFWATVEIAKVTVWKYAIFDDEDWSVFRGDTPSREANASDVSMKEAA